MGHMKNRDSNRKRREDRQEQAKVRQEAYSKLTNAEKLAKLDAEGRSATKQRARILAGPAVTEKVIYEGPEGAVSVVEKKTKKPHRNDKKALKAQARKEQA